MMMAKQEVGEKQPGLTTMRASAKKAPADTVADLERRLAELSAINPTPPAPAMEQPSAPPSFAQPPPQPQQASKPASGGGGGKNALLARIMAAQEKAKQAQQGKSPSNATGAPPAYSDAPPAYSDAPPAYSAAPPSYMEAPPAYSEAPDLMNFDAPPSSSAPPPPPAFDMSLLPPPSASELPPPPAFDDSIFPPAMDDTKPAATFNWDPHAPAPLLSGAAPIAPPSASAPLFEDLMDAHPPPMQHSAWEPMPPPMADNSYMQQQQQKSDEDEAIAAILAIEGLSPAEKEEMIAEQRKIMASIEKKKSNSQFSAADAFEQRSLSAAVGASRNRPSAQFQDAAFDGMTDAEREQMKEDMKLAEQLQKMEYEEADKQTKQRQQEKREKKKSSAKQQSTPPEKKEEKKQDQGWMEWLGIGGASAAPAAAAAAAKKERERMIEDEGFAVSGQQPLFACVTDSISTATTYAMNTNYLEEDDDGNVNGVDSSGLLAVTQVGRNKTG